MLTQHIVQKVPCGDKSTTVCGGKSRSILGPREKIEKKKILQKIIQKPPNIPEPADLVMSELKEGQNHTHTHSLSLSQNRNEISDRSAREAEKRCLCLYVCIYMWRNEANGAGCVYMADCGATAKIVGRLFESYDLFGNLRAAQSALEVRTREGRHTMIVKRETVSKRHT